MASEPRAKNLAGRVCFSGSLRSRKIAPSAGPPPWYVDELTPEDVYAVGGGDPGRATRWTSTF